MFGARKTAVLFSAALLVACEPVSEPEVGQPPPNFQRGPVTSSVTGHGNILVAGGTKLRTFSFAAVERADGSVSGRFQGFNRGSGGRISGRVTCFSIKDGSAAWIAGVIEQANFNVIGVETGFRAVDNGPPSSAVPDQLSRFAVRVDDAQAFCDSKPDIAGPLRDIVAGNIRVQQ